MKLTKSQLRQMIREELKPLMPTPPEKSAEIIIDTFFTYYKKVNGYLPREISMEMLMDKIKTYKGNIDKDLLKQMAQKKVDQYKR
tara:strand:- start:709 stop:963 length:255 start_codon:yes stop_codon:yes gene_type:complete